MASRDLQVDDLILTEAPLVLGPKQETEPLCLGCYRRVTGKYRSVSKVRKLSGK